MVDLRTDSERIVRELKQGEHMILSYRGVPLAELVPTATHGKNMSPMEALNHARELALQEGPSTEKYQAYLKELREDQQSWAERTPT